MSRVAGSAAAAPGSSIRADVSKTGDTDAATGEDLDKQSSCCVTLAVHMCTSLDSLGAVEVGVLSGFVQCAAHRQNRLLADSTDRYVAAWRHDSALSMLTRSY